MENWGGTFVWDFTTDRPVVDWWLMVVSDLDAKLHHLHAMHSLSNLLLISTDWLLEIHPIETSGRSKLIQSSNCKCSNSICISNLQLIHNKSKRHTTNLQVFDRSNKSRHVKISCRLQVIYNKLWCEAQQTPPLLPPSEWQWLVNASELWPVITKKLTFDPPTRLPELTQNLIRSSHGHSTPSLKISCKSVQPFSRNVADKETKKERK